MIVGLYGFSSELSPEQIGQINNLLKKMKPNAIHRYNNNGIDYDFHQISIASTKSKIIVHPLNTYHVLKGCSHRISKVLPPKSSPVRDQEFVNVCETIIVALDE